MAQGRVNITNETDERLSTLQHKVTAHVQAATLTADDMRLKREMITVSKLVGIMHKTLHRGLTIHHSKNTGTFPYNRIYH